MDRFALKPGRWYAAELIGEEFGDEIRSYSAIKVEELTPQSGRRFSLAFYHANYPEGVRGKVYELETIERTATFILARSREHTPVRLMLIYPINRTWLREHFGVNLSELDDAESWLSRNT